MSCENKVGKEFDSLAQRLVYSYIVSYSKFIPADIQEITVEAQKQTHIFLSGVLSKIFENPAIIGLPLEKDDYFDREAFKNKPELTKTMKNLEMKFLGFFNFLFILGINGELKNNKLYIPNTKMKLQKSKLALLEQVGLKSESISDGVIIYSEEYPELCSGLISLSKICELVDGRDIPDRITTTKCMATIMFMKCLYNMSNFSFDRLYGDMEQSGTYLKELDDYFVNHGFKYIRYDASLRLHKAYPNKQDGSFTVTFDWRRKNQLAYSIDLPSVRVLMEYFDKMDSELKDLVFSRTKTCDTCGYCAQTGKREIVAVQLKYNDAVINKCPYYPNFSWNTLNKKTVDVIKELFDLTENILCTK